jgi:peptidoglycan/LPS O-acetylase OafA/YrhL
MPYPDDIRPLTGLRFIAAFWLLLYFFWDRFGLGARDLVGLVHAGSYGVDLFFILSGFILAHVYGRQIETKQFSWRGFIWARLARIYPLHLFCLLIMVSLWAVAKGAGAQLPQGAFEVSQIPAHLFLVQAWGVVGSDGWNFPSWSISAEWFAYLIFPLGFGLLAHWAKKPLIGIAFMGIVFAAMVYGLAQMDIVLMDMTWQGGIVRIVPSFGMGIALWFLGRDLKLPNGISGLGIAASVAWIGLAAVLAWPSYLLWPGLAALVFFVAASSKSNQTPVLASPIMVYLGEISFAAYMVHLPIDIVFYQGVERLWGQPTGIWAILIGLCAIGLSLVGAALAHGLVEKPARQ